MPPDSGIFACLPPESGILALDVSMGIQIPRPRCTAHELCTMTVEVPGYHILPTGAKARKLIPMMCGNWEPQLYCWDIQAHDSS